MIGTVRGTFIKYCLCEFPVIIWWAARAASAPNTFSKPSYTRVLPSKKRKFDEYNKALHSEDEFCRQVGYQIVRRRSSTFQYYHLL